MGCTSSKVTDQVYLQEESLNQDQHDRLMISLPKTSNNDIVDTESALSTYREKPPVFETYVEELASSYEFRTTFCGGGGGNERNSEFLHESNPQFRICAPAGTKLKLHIHQEQPWGQRRSVGFFCFGTSAQLPLKTLDVVDTFVHMGKMNTNPVEAEIEMPNNGIMIIVLSRVHSAQTQYIFTIDSVDGTGIDCEHTILPPYFTCEDLSFTQSIEGSFHPSNSGGLIDSGSFHLNSKTIFTVRGEESQAFCINFEVIEGFFQYNYYLFNSNDECIFTLNKPNSRSSNSRLFIKPGRYSIVPATVVKGVEGVFKIGLHCATDFSLHMKNHHQDKKPVFEHDGRFNVQGFGKDGNLQFTPHYLLNIVNPETYFTVKIDIEGSVLYSVIILDQMQNIIHSSRQTSLNFVEVMMLDVGQYTMYITPTNPHAQNSYNMSVYSQSDVLVEKVKDHVCYSNNEGSVEYIFVGEFPEDGGSSWAVGHWNNPHVYLEGSGEIKLELQRVKHFNNVGVSIHTVNDDSSLFSNQNTTQFYNSKLNAFPGNIDLTLSLPPNQYVIVLHGVESIRGSFWLRMSCSPSVFINQFGLEKVTSIPVDDDKIAFEQSFTVSDKIPGIYDGVKAVGVPSDHVGPLVAFNDAEVLLCGRSGLFKVDSVEFRKQWCVRYSGLSHSEHEPVEKFLPAIVQDKNVCCLSGLLWFSENTDLLDNILAANHVEHIQILSSCKIFKNSPKTAHTFVVWEGVDLTVPTVVAMRYNDFYSEERCHILSELIKQSPYIVILADFKQWYTLSNYRQKTLAFSFPLNVMLQEHGIDIQYILGAFQSSDCPTPEMQAADPDIDYADIEEWWFAVEGGSTHPFTMFSTEYSQKYIKYTHFSQTGNALSILADPKSNVTLNERVFESLGHVIEMGLFGLDPSCDSFTETIEKVDGLLPSVLVCNEQPVNHKHVFKRAQLARDVARATVGLPVEVDYFLTFPGDIRNHAAKDQVVTEIQIPEHIPGGNVGYTYGYLPLDIYIPPRTKVLVCFEGADFEGCQIQVGVHGDNAFFTQKPIKRFPECTQRFDIISNKVEFYSEVGGPLMFYLPYNAPQRRNVAGKLVTITAENCVPMIHHRCFQGEELPRATDAPWFFLESRHILLVLPSRFITALEADDIMVEYDKMVEYLLDFPVFSKYQWQIPHFIVPDPSPSNGGSAAHAGNPIVTYIFDEQGYNLLFDVGRFSTKGDGELALEAHEIAHNLTFGMSLCFEGVIEGIACYLSAYAAGKATGRSIYQNPRFLKGRQYALLFLGDSTLTPHDRFKRMIADAYVLGAQFLYLIDEAFPIGLAKYLEMEMEAPYFENNSERRNFSIVTMSKACNVSMLEYYDKWGIPFDDASRSTVEALNLESWMPELLQ
ncbi:hypothetical protein PCE1_002673 [Barthelona sp. PCE]